jgi:hypothetical protein
MVFSDIADLVECAPTPQRTRVWFPPMSSFKAVLWLRRLVAGLSPLRPRFAPGSIHVGFVVDKVALGQVFLPVLRFSPTNIISPLLHTHLSPRHEVCDSSDQAAQCHHLGPKLGASFLTRHFGWKQNKKVKKIWKFLSFLCLFQKVIPSILFWKLYSFSFCW